MTGVNGEVETVLVLDSTKERKDNSFITAFTDHCSILRNISLSQ